MRLSLHRRTLHLRAPFTIARGTTTHRETTIVELSDGARAGFGEVSDNSYYPLAHPAAVAGYLGGLEPVLAQADPDDPQALHAEVSARDGLANPFALSALDVAAHDLAARRAEQPLYAYWGFAWDRGSVPVSNYTLSIDTPERVLAQAEANPWPSYKVKLGGEHDLTTLRRLRENLPAARLCVDANAGWTPGEAFAKTQQLAALEVTFVEQPLPVGGDIGALRKRLAALDPPVLTPLVADEDCQTEGDVARCAAAGYEAVNIKLSKCGGPTAALRMVAEARQLGLGVMFGCMVESSFAIGALRHFAPVADFIDLDGAMLVRDDPATEVPFLEDGRPARPEGWGSGAAWQTAAR